tara:strand:- start:70 stop:1002 length:933 start_codon:yes stop_codon:yes gene_type:complete
MADNLTTQSGTPATVPSASVIATDDVSSVHFQKVKLDVGGDGVSVPASGDATNGLDVDVTRVQGTVTVGDGGGTISVDDGGGTLTVDGTVAVTGAYQATQPVSLATAPTTPVTGTFWQTTQPVSGTVAVTGVATELTLASVDTKTPALGQALAAYSVPVILPSATITTLTPPAAISGFATDTKQSDGTQKSQIVDGSGNVIGSTTNALDVNIQSGSISEKPITAATLTNVTSSATTATILASNSNRRMATIYNDSTSALYLKYGATASATSYTIKMEAGAYYELPTPVYTGVLDGIWISANGFARVTEMV